MCRQKIAGGYTHVSRELLVTPDHAALQCHNFTFHSFSGGENVLACRRESITMGRAVKQPHSQSLLEGDDTARDSGVVYAEQVGGGTYCRMPNHSQKYLDVVPIHAECSVRHLLAALTHFPRCLIFAPARGKFASFRAHRRWAQCPVCIADQMVAPPERQCTNRGLFDHDKFNSLHQMPTSSGYRVGCFSAFDWKTKYRTCGARGVTKRISGRRRAQLLRNVARPPG